MVLPLIDIDAAVPRVILLPVLIELLVIEEQFDDFFAAALASDVKARSLVLFAFLVRHTNLAELVYDVVVALETCVVESVESVHVLLLRVGDFVTQNQLHNNLIAETARQHQWCHAVRCDREVHIYFDVQRAEIEQVLEVVMVDCAENFLLPRRQLVVDV